MGALAQITIQAGHSAWTSWSGRRYPAGGGAPGEAAWALKLAHLIADRLRRRGVAVLIIGQWLNLPAPPEASSPAALFVSLHYDAAVYSPPTGCFAGRAAGDPSGDLADDLIRGWNAIYPRATGIPLHPERANVANVRDYYAFRDTPAEVPGVLLEHGCGSPVPVPPHPAGGDAAFLHGQIELVADADAAAIVAHLIERGLLPAEEAEDVAKIAELQAKVDELVSTNSALGDQVNALRQEVGERNADVTRLRAEHERLLDEIDSLQKDVVALMAKLAAVPTEKRTVRRWVYSDGEVQDVA